MFWERVAAYLVHIQACIYLTIMILLVSLPIPVRSVIMARLTSVYIMGFITIPSVIVYWTVIEATHLTIICSIIFIFIISWIVLILSCVLGWCVAKLASKAKNKNNVTMVMSLVFMGIYYLVFDKAQKIINAFIMNVVILGQSVKNRYIHYICWER